MLAELFEISSSFFFLSVILSIIVFVYLMKIFLQEKRYSVGKSILLATLSAIAAYIVGCIAIVIIVAVFTAYVMYIVIIFLIVAVCLGVLGS